MKLQIVVTRRITSRISMRIGKDGVVRVSAPYGVPKSYISRFVESHSEWIAKAQERSQRAQSGRNAFFSRLKYDTKEEKQAVIARLDAIVSPMVMRHAAIMGVHPSRITYKKVISKWGSCNTGTRELNFSIYLLLLPEYCIEHVVVHELAHLLVPNHGPEFHRTMDKYFPEWKKARLETNRILRSAI